VLGVGQSSDAFHALRPDPSTYGPDLAIDRSLVAAQLNTGDVDLICGHGTGTKANDEVESELYQYKFPGDIPLFATKGIHGHTAGAGGILELIVLLECLRTSYLPACECWHPETPSYSDRRPFDIGVKTGLAIGGLNTSIIVAKPNVDLPREPTMQGVCSAGEATLYSTDWLSPDRQPTEINDTLLSKFQCSLETSATPEFNGGALAQVPRRDWKRLDLLTKMVVSMCGFLLQQVKSIGPDRIGLSYATNLGPMCSWLIASDAMRRGKPLNPRIIPNLSFNSAPSTACATYSLRGPVVSYTSGMQGGMYAFEHAAMVLELGLADAMVVIVADEFTGDHVDDPMFESLSGFDHNLDVLSSVHQGAANPLAIPAVGGILLCRGDLIEGLIDPERIVPIGREVTSGNLAEELGDAKVAPSGTWQSVARFSDLVTTIGVKRTLGSLLESDRKDRIVKSVN
jgi:3-oxoacyl-[acyl-carrier-protein] synthase II